jgi:glycosyltransferase involved in cell wall biosynthesis
VWRGASGGLFAPPSSLVGITDERSRAVGRRSAAADSVTGQARRRAACSGETPLKVLVLTTSYPRDSEDIAGRFVADAVEQVRARGFQVDVVSPASFSHYGIAYGHGIVGNLRAQPWRVALLPAFLRSFRRAAISAARDADVVHAHWLAAGAVAATLGKPYVVQVWGTDLELARRVPRLARWIMRRARLVVAASSFLAEEARILGARDVRVVPSGVAIPEFVREPEEPPHVLYVGRLSAEKGIVELVEASHGLALEIVGDGPLRSRVPGSLGFVAPTELGRHYERAAVVAAPSRREGYGVVAREAMAWGRPVVASRVGGLVDAVEDGVTGVLVPPGDIAALREALERLLADAQLRDRLGAAGRVKAMEELSFEAATDALVAVYDEVFRRST